jgi:hypothetical protein
VPAWNAYSYAFGPLFALLAFGILVLLLRWAFARGSSVVAAPPRTGRPEEYGLLVPVATPGSYVEGEVLRRRLVAAGLRATLAQTVEGPRVLVFPDDEARARQVLGAAP